MSQYLPVSRYPGEVLPCLELLFLYCPHPRTPVKFRSHKIAHADRGRIEADIDSSHKGHILAHADRAHSM